MCEHVMLMLCIVHVKVNNALCIEMIKCHSINSTILISFITPNTKATCLLLVTR